MPNLFQRLPHTEILYVVKSSGKRLGVGRTLTCVLLLSKQALLQLSYDPHFMRLNIWI